MTKSIRIKNSNGDKATIWPVGEFHYSVKWDDEQVTHTIASSDVDKSFYYDSWKEIENDELPDTFKFTIVNGVHDSYTATKKYDIYVVSWGDSYGVSYTIPEVKKHLESGNWLMLEDGFVPQFTQECEVSGLMKFDSVLPSDFELNAKDNLLQTIKQFVEEFDAQVAMCKEGYLIYSDNETIDPYRANSDEELKEILQAIRVLKKYEGV